MIIKNSDVNKTRKRHIDVAKAILIMLIVVGHSGTPFESFIYLFHVAGFILISGYLFNVECTHFWTHLRKRIVRLWVPYVVYMVILLCLHNVMVRIGIYNTPKITSIGEYAVRFINIILLGNGAGDMAGAMWFIPLLFEVSILFSVIHLITNRWKYGELIKGMLILLLFAGGYILLELGYTLPRYMDTTLLVLPVYYIGTLYRKYEHKIPMHFALFLLSFVALFLLNKLGSVSLSDKNINNPAFFLTATICGSYMVIYIATKLTKYFSGKALGFAGKFTFDIMSLHFLAFKIVSVIYIVVLGISFDYLASFPTIKNDGFLWIAYSVIGIIVPIGIKVLYDTVRNCIRGRARPVITSNGGEET